MLLCAVLLALVAALPAQEGKSSSSAEAKAPAPKAKPFSGNTEAQALVRKAVDAQLKSAGELPQRFLLRRETPNRIETRELIETSAGLVARTVALGDRPLTREERTADDLRLEELLADPKLQKEKLEEQRANTERVTRLVRALPDAFLYEFDGSEPGPSGQLIRLKFKPNPNFDPPSKETNVYKGMEGTLWIDASAARIVRLDATTVKQVNFGWGLLGHLDKGGTFKLRQSEIAPGRWEITNMQLNFTGKVLIFKSIKVQQTQSTWHFRPVPRNLTLADGVDLLRKHQPLLAELVPPSASF